MYKQALKIIKEDGFPPNRDGLPVLDLYELKKLSDETGEPISKLAFYFAETWRDK